MKPTALLLTLLCAAALLLAAGGVQAQRFPRLLENIKMYGKGETIEFVFSQPYEGNPVVEHSKGAFSLSFSGTGSTKPVRSLRPVDESIYKEIKVVENRYSTTVTFHLKDPTPDLRDKLSFAPNNKVLKVTVNAPAAAPASSPQGQATEELLRQMESRIAGGAAAGGTSVGGATGQDAARAPTPGLATAPAAEAAGSTAGTLVLGDLGGNQFFYSLVTMVIALVIIVATLYGVLYLYNRFLATRLRRFTGSHAIRQVASFHIGPRQRIVVLEINDEIIACGVTPAQITYLTHLGGKGPVGRAPDADGLPGGEAGGGARPGGTHLGGAVAPDKAPSDDPVHQFAEVLKQKVRSLKRIN